MGTNIAGAGNGLITTTARRPGTTVTKPALGPQPPHERYARARKEGTDVPGWRSLARAYDWSADNADTLVRRQQLRALADECRANAERLASERRAVAA